MRLTAYSHTAPSIPIAVARYGGADYTNALQSQDVPRSARTMASPQEDTGMRTGIRKAWIVAYALVLVAFTVFVLLDTFAIERVVQQVSAPDTTNITQVSTASEEAQVVVAEDTDTQQETQNVSTTAAGTDDGMFYSDHKAGVAPSQASEEEAEVTEEAVEQEAVGEEAAEAAEETSVVASSSDLSYSDENISIAVQTLRVNETDVYVADIQVSSAEYLKTALAQNAYGRNLKDTTSNMAESAGAILAVNGDYYGFRDEGYVIRNGVLYRDVPAQNTDALVVYGDGTMSSVNQSSITAQELLDAGAWQVFSFGPVLVEDGQVVVGENSEVGQAMGSNPRTAIGMIDPLHYVVVASNGRTSDNEGLSLQELAQVMADAGATFAYNLDGGGSTTMWFQGEVLNDPTSGHRDGERQVSDIVYFG